MKTWIALFRGINVGGNNILPMAELRQHFASLGFENVRSYIQSGNVVFQARAKTAAPLVRRISNHVKKHYSVQPKLLLLDEDQLHRAIDSNPFPEAVSEPKTLHFFFLAESPPNPDCEALESAVADGESFELIDDVFYFYSPNGSGRSRLASNAEKYLGVTTTARNFRTVTKLLAMVTEAA